MITEIPIQSTAREEFIDITSRIARIVGSTGCRSGYLICCVPHTTAGITINENADPDVRRDLIHKLRQEIPQSDGYQHAEGNSDAHLKASLMGFSQTVLIESGKLVLGTWQGIYFCEFDGPRHRKLLVKVIPDA
ncbi:MAG: secondary thiamine-phosphate synthase enzyme YjbQ [candidate division Zixibacteria bacterium]|nr:secondary thiamine-phosphate synthase enzyme YjbQ [candidate division Zixibacteria bacterium]